tara:strand:- start:36870 stop:37661 length:792 start_codon:yes stop_codon:yes gene_type:complete
MDLTLGTFSFLFLRLAPFILICFFTLSSIFNNDLRGVVYLFGVLFSIFITFLIGGNQYFELGEVTENRSAICDSVLFGKGNDGSVPVGETIIGFTFFYLFTTLILKDREYINKVVNFENIPNVPSLLNSIVTPWQMLSLDFLKFIPSMLTNIPNIKNNLPTIAFFITLILFDLFWNTNWFTGLKELWQMPTSYCYTTRQTIAAYTIGIIIGIFWSNIIFSTDTPEIQYFPEYKNNEVCKRVSSTTYKCKVYKKGVLVNTFNTT